jgi:hypothetical protein
MYLFRKEYSYSFDNIFDINIGYLTFSFDIYLFIYWETVIKYLLKIEDT